MSFHSEWLREHEAHRCFDSWDIDGFHPEKTDLPEDIQLLEVTTYAISTIMCDSLVTFFEAWIGDTAPEVVRTLDRLGFAEVSLIIKEAMDLVGSSPYLRDPDLRSPSVDRHRTELRELSRSLYKALPKLIVFYEACDCFLKEVLATEE